MYQNHSVGIYNSYFWKYSITNLNITLITIFSRLPGGVMILEVTNYQVVSSMGPQKFWDQLQKF